MPEMARQTVELDARSIVERVVAVQALLDECYVAMKVNEKLMLYGRRDELGERVCHGVAMALGIIKGTDGIDEWNACKERFEPDGEAFAVQEARMREVLGL